MSTSRALAKGLCRSSLLRLFPSSSHDRCFARAPRGRVCPPPALRIRRRCTRRCARATPRRYARTSTRARTTWTSRTSRVAPRCTWRSRRAFAWRAAGLCSPRARIRTGWTPATGRAWRRSTARSSTATSASPSRSRCSPRARASTGGLTPLHLAVRSGHDALARLLISRGADVNARARDGRTPLHLAAAGGHESAVKLLLDHRADRRAKNKEFLTPDYEAARAAHAGVVDLILGPRDARGVNAPHKKKKTSRHRRHQ